MNGKYILKKVEMTDIEFIRKLRNSKKNVNFFINKKYIDKKSHELYMIKNHKNYYIATNNGEKIGYVGCISNDIRLCVRDDYKRKGVGLFMLTEIKKIFPSSQAKIYKKNIASRRLFDKVDIKVEII